MANLVLITGGSSGIGKAAAKVLVSKGHRVILLARNAEKLESASREVDPSGNLVHTYSADLTQPASVQKIAHRICEELGVPDVVVNSAGAGEWFSLAESTLEHFRETIESPYLATAYTCKAFYKAMKKRGSGHFVVVNSVACYVPIPGAIGYNATRVAMLGLARSLHADLRSGPLNVSMIALGKVDSPYFTNNPVSEERIPRAVDWLTPTLSEFEAGKAVANLVERPRAEVVRPQSMRTLIYLNRFFPKLIKWVMWKTGYRAAH